jgi:basic membrane protein A
MKKSLICAALAGAVLFFGACGKQRQAAAPSGGQETAADDQVTIRLVADVSGIDDKGFNAGVWEGILRFYGDTWENASQRGGPYDVLNGQSSAQYVPLLQQVTDEGYGLIVAAGFSWADAIGEVAAKNPNQNYMLIDEGGLNQPNLLQAVFAEHEGSFLVGVAAALKAKADNIANPQFGFIGGIAGETITKFEVGYVQGILSVLPNAGIRDYYVGSWDDPGSAKTQAKNWYDSGVYAIFSAAGSSGNGTIAQAKEYRAQGRNVWAIGVDLDQYDMGLYTDSDSAVLTSMLKRVDNATIYGLNAVKNKTFKGGTMIFDLKADGVGCSTTNTKAMTGDIVDQVEQIRQRILSGEIKIAATYAAAKQLPGFPQDLKALDN